MDTKLPNLPAGGPIQPDDLFYSEQAGVSVRQRAASVQSFATGMRVQAPKAGINLYVDPVSGSNSNTGLAPGTGDALATWSKAIDLLLDQYDMRGAPPNIILADGTYTEANIEVFGLDGSVLDISLGGAAGHASSVIWAVPAGEEGMQIKDSGCLTFHDITIQGGTGAECIAVNQTGILDTEPSVIFGNCPGGTHIVGGSGGSVNLDGHTITGTSYQFHLVALGSTNVSFSNNPISLVAATFTSFLYGLGGATFNTGGVTFTGAGALSGSTGTKFLMEAGAQLLTNGRDPNTVFPGATPGTVTLSHADGTLSSIPGYAFAALPSHPQSGATAVITDSTTGTSGAAVTTGGGTHVVFAMYGATQWTVVVAIP